METHRTRPSPRWRRPRAGDGRRPVVVEDGATVNAGAVLEGPILVRSGATVGPNAYVRGRRCSAETSPSATGRGENSVIRRETAVSPLVRRRQRPRTERELRRWNGGRKPAPRRRRRRGDRQGRPRVDRATKVRRRRRRRRQYRHQHCLLPGVTLSSGRRHTRRDARARSVTPVLAGRFWAGQPILCPFGLRSNHGPAITHFLVGATLLVFAFVPIAIRYDLGREHAVWLIPLGGVWGCSRTSTTSRPSSRPNCTQCTTRPGWTCSRFTTRWIGPSSAPATPRAYSARSRRSSSP